MRGVFSVLGLAMLGCSGGSASPPTEVQTDSSTAADSQPEDTGVPVDDTGVVGEAGSETTPETSTMVDKDGDGLDDALEEKLAADYLPFLSLDPADKCARAVIVFRVYPHPDAKATRLHLIYDTLFEKDCGASGHVGDNEVFALTVDPAKPAPEGILAMRAISHQGTACEAITNCGSCSGLEKCTTATKKGAAFPVVFYSKDKHGSYLQESKCDNSCFFTNFCVLAPTSTEPKMINAGEPEMPLANNLTTAGMITGANGWTEMSVFNYEIWGGKEFGGAGKVNEDLIDKAFLTPACP